MARGNQAKDNLINKFIEAAGDKYLGMFDKKYYFLSPENGEQIQVAVSMTCPKTPVEFADSVDTDGDWDFTDDKPKTANSAVVNAAPAEITQQEVQNIEELMKKLGL
jgi:hypothetical protein